MFGEHPYAERDDELQNDGGRHVLHTFHDAQREPPERRTDNHAADHSEQEGWRNRSNGKPAGSDGSYGETIDQQRAGVIQQALAFEDRQDAMRWSQSPQHGGCGRGVGWRDDGAEGNRRRPGHGGHQRSRHHRDGTTSPGYFPMNKDVGSLIHYQEQALACNRRYLDALVVVDDPAPAYQELRQLTEPKVVAGRSYAGFNPARRDDVRLFAAVLDGDHIARGFRNKDIRAALFGNDTKPGSRHSAAVGRLVKRLHTRQLVAKIPRTRRWRVTESGRHLLSLAVQLYRQSWPELLAA